MSLGWMGFSSRPFVLDGPGIAYDDHSKFAFMVTVLKLSRCHSVLSQALSRESSSSSTLYFYDLGCDPLHVHQCPDPEFLIMRFE